MRTNSLKVFGALALAAVACSTLACSSSGDGAATSDTETGDDEDILAGRRLPQSEVAALLRQVGIPERDVPRLVCTAKYESSFFAGAQNRNKNGSVDYGLFQINDRVWLKPCGVTPGQLLDPAANARCAKRVYDQQGLGAWYGYKAHAAECDRFAVGGGASPSSSADDGCWSATLGARVEPRVCVQSRATNAWYQCVDGRWYRARASAGPAGACSEEHPLE